MGQQYQIDSQSSIFHYLLQIYLFINLDLFVYTKIFQFYIKYC